jgi:2-amino-4-hydroxy-6-hydroxymethyldihydropteridine diphosphokinase
MDSIVLSLGSNIGDRHAYIDEACKLLEERDVKIDRKSAIYESEPVGFTGQDEFLNQILVVETELSPMQLLDICLQVEQHMGRIRVEKNGPRNIDIDLLFYKDEIMSEKTLLLPHPRVAERRFILVPLAELLPDELHPVMDVSFQELLENCEDDSMVERSA